MTNEYLLYRFPLTSISPKEKTVMLFSLIKYWKANFIEGYGNYYNEV